jgi:AcrR family transcriptional regulator
MAPRSKKAAEIMRGRSRDAILGAALELFARRGYSATTAEAIARRAGISKGLIFTHFRTKKDILIALFEEQFGAFFPRFFPESDLRPPRERLTAMVEAWFQIIKSEPLLIRLSLQLNLDDEYRTILRNKKVMRYYDMFLRKLTKTFRELGSDKPELDAFVLMFFFDGASANYTVTPELFPVDAIKDRLLHLLTSGHARSSHAVQTAAR